jgi:glycine/D-amino acid oxidase-like deaminating enzyme
MAYVFNFPNSFLAITTTHSFNSVFIATGYGLDGWGSIPGRGKRFLFTPQLPDRL